MVKLTAQEWYTITALDYDEHVKPSVLRELIGKDVVEQTETGFRLRRNVTVCVDYTNGTDTTE